jgi:4-amino-4-deoxy-L-arabinose transferase-like glycosyltransferase
MTDPTRNESLPRARLLFRPGVAGEALRLVKKYWGALPVVVVIALLGLRACLATPPLDNLSRVAAEPTDPPGTTAYAGSLYIARGGPVIVGFQTGADARLVVGTGADTKELRGRGIVKDRVILPSGAVPIRFAAPADTRARLVWSPVGRRGDPEYVPASSLSPQSPDRAEFPSWVGAAPFDGVIAALILLVIIASCVMLARHRLAKVPRPVWISVAVVFAAGCIVRWTDLGGFGQTWDEDVNWAAGRNYITNILSFDIAEGSWNWNYEHPPVMKYLAGIGAQFTDGFGPARALSAIWMSLGCSLLVPIGARLYNHRVGVLAAVIATLLPHLVAHGQIVGHESPTVLWWTLGILLALGVRDGEPTYKQIRLRLVAVGVVIGVAFASRLVNGLLGVLCLAIVIDAAPSRRLFAALEAALIMPLTALLTFYALWPRIWLSPLSALGKSGGKLGQLHAPEPFLGVITNQPPRYYFLLYLAITVPIAILPCILGWFARTASERGRGGLITALWLVVPLAVMFSPVRQDGVRYVMPCVVVIALMAAAGWDYTAGLVKRHADRVFGIGSCALVVYMSITLMRQHPYYLDYYGEQVGGPEEVAQKSIAETAWWGEGLAEAVGYVNAHAAPGARVFRNCILPVHLAWFREDLWPTMTNQLRSAEWVVAYSPLTNRCPIPPELERAYVVEVRGAVLAIVYRAKQR